MCGYENSKNIHLIYLISTAVTYKDYHSQSDRLSSYLVFREPEVIFATSKQQLMRCFIFKI